MIKLHVYIILLILLFAALGFLLKKFFIKSSYLFPFYECKCYGDLFNDILFSMYHNLESLEITPTPFKKKRYVQELQFLVSELKKN